MDGGQLFLRNGSTAAMVMTGVAQVGNCEIGEDAHYSAAYWEGRAIGACFSPLCSMVALLRLLYPLLPPPSPLACAA